MNQLLRVKVESSCAMANDFVKFYYQSFDKQRHQINKLFYDTGIFVWNGNAANGKDNIQKFISELPKSEHNVTTLDVQPISEAVVGVQPTYILQTGGTVKFGNKPPKAFQQSFVITAVEHKWKILSDVYRLHDALAIPDK